MTMKLTLPLIAIASIAVAGCSSGAQCVGYCDADSGEVDSGDDDTGGVPTASSSGTTDDTAASDSTSEESDTGSDSSGGEPTDLCDGDPFAVCLPATEDADALCLCSEPLGISADHFSAVPVDFDGDGNLDLLTFPGSEPYFQPFLTTDRGLEPQEVVETPSEVSFFVAGRMIAGALHFIPFRNFGNAEIWSWTPGAAITVTPFTAAIPDDVAFNWYLADFDADGAVDLMELWSPELGDASASVSFDVMGAPSLWSTPAPNNPFASAQICRLDDDAADDVLLGSLRSGQQPLLGQPMTASMTLGDTLSGARGLCKDLDGDGDADLFAPAVCSDCSPPFGPYVVYEQTTPLQFEQVASGGELGEGLVSSGSTTMHLHDASAFDIVSLGRDGVLAPLDPPKTNFAVRRATGPLSWEEGRYSTTVGFGVETVVPIDVDLDGLDELVVRIVDEDGERGLYLYRLVTE